MDLAQYKFLPKAFFFPPFILSQATACLVTIGIVLSIGMKSRTEILDSQQEECEKLNLNCVLFSNQVVLHITQFLLFSLTVIEVKMIIYLLQINCLWLLT